MPVISVVFDAEGYPCGVSMVQERGVIDWTGKVVLGGHGTPRGVASGKTRRCQLESCGGERVHVRWPDGKYTYPCAKGLMLHANGEYQIR